MQVYSILFLDIDGTVLDTQNRFSGNLKHFFKQLNREEIPIVLNSSRSPAGTAEIRRVTGIHSPCICYGGGLITGEKGQVIDECGIPVEDALRLYRRICSLPYDISVSFFAYDAWMTACRKHPMIIREAEITGCEPVECDFESIVTLTRSIHKILCIGEHNALEELITREKAEFAGMQMLFSKTDYLEITSREASKGNAVRRVCGYYGISPEKTVAAGDGMIDRSMLEACGCGIAMGNSLDALKRIADVVAPHADDDGLYKALKDLNYRRVQDLINDKDQSIRLP